MVSFVSSGLTSLANGILAGHLAFFSFISEMKEPSEYPKVNLASVLMSKKICHGGKEGRQETDLLIPHPGSICLANLRYHSVPRGSSGDL